jgi:hypothetical protein
MKITNNCCLLFAVFLFSFFGFVNSAFAGMSQNVSGFAWSENIGWISFNATDCGVCTGVNCTSTGLGGCPTPAGTSYKDYGVNIKSSGSLEGYAWSSGVGWISFEPVSVSGCPGAPCDAYYDSGTKKITGWARACSVFASGCSGALKTSNELGGWDGWIRLSGTAQSGIPYGLDIDAGGDFHGYAYGAANSGIPEQGVIGWISFNCKEGGADGDDICANSDYKVSRADSVPKAKMSCSMNCPNGGSCDNNPNSTWILYWHRGQCATCNFTVNNDSTGVIQKTTWEWVGTGYSLSYTGKANFTYQSYVPAIASGTYKMKLTIENSFGSDSVSHWVEIKNEILAGFMCAFKDPAVTLPAAMDWQDCNSSDFKSKVIKDKMVYVTDNPLLSDYSTPSQGAAISTRLWTITVDGIPVTANGDSTNFAAGRSNRIRLDVTDNDSRTNCKWVDINGITIPKWQEVSPVGMIWHYLTTGITKLFTTL